jgi:ABC-type sugar transport system substrate-binding protein
MRDDHVAQTTEEVSMTGSRTRRLVAIAFVAAVAAVAVAAASSAPRRASHTAAETPVTGYKFVGSSSAVAAARAAGLKDAGSRVALPKGKSIGLILLSGQSPTSIRITNAAKQIGKLLGYAVHVCDPNFDAQKIQQCGTSIIAQNPSVIFSVSTNPGPFGSAVQQAAQRGIPWIGVASRGTDAPGFTNYGISGFEMAKLYDQWFFEAVASKNAGKKPFKLLALTAPTVGISAVNHEKQFRADLAKMPAYKLTINHNLDLANVVQDTLNATKQALQQYPNLAGVWTYCDICIPLVAQVVNGVQSGKRTTVVSGMFSTPQVISDIRSGRTDGVADYAWETEIWAGIDQVLQKWARGKAIAPDFSVFKRYSLSFMQPYMITKENARTSGPAPILGPDFVTYFKTKWGKEFGVK